MYKERKEEKRKSNILKNIGQLGIGASSGMLTGYSLANLTPFIGSRVDKPPGERIVKSAKAGHYGTLAGNTFRKLAQEAVNNPASGFNDPIYKNSLIQAIVNRRGALLGGLGGLGYTGYHLYKNRKKDIK